MTREAAWKRISLNDNFSLLKAKISITEIFHESFEKKFSKNLMLTH